MRDVGKGQGIDIKFISGLGPAPVPIQIDVD